MVDLEEPKKGDLISHEWAISLVRAIKELQKGPDVVAPLANQHGSIYFADNYLLQMVKTTSTITARSGDTLGSGTAKFIHANGPALSDAMGYNTTTIYSQLGTSIISGARGVVAWVDEQWVLISADCTGAS